MRKDDFHTRAFIYPQLVNGTRKNDIKIKVIDLGQNVKQQKRIQKNYKGMKNVEFSFDGFNIDSLKWLKNDIDVN
ncbi:MAG: hypothetical protein EA412_08405 [Chitinophagaceae bacterium]|nr:MAG: hypothetical protein EA412_08405 [Chitinophagaceae bacterium]